MVTALTLGLRAAETALERARAGDEAAFEELIRGHEQRVIRVGWRILGSLEEGQDVAQEVLLRLFKSLGAVRSEEELAGWLYRVTVNECRSRVRRRRRWFRVEEHHAVAAPVDGADAAWLRWALGQLPEREREAAVLRELEGLDTREVAALLGITEATVRSHVSHGLERMRALAGGK